MPAINTRPTSISVSAERPVPRAVLIVDDDPLCAEMLGDLITHAYSSPPPIERAGTLAEARTILARRPQIDTILLDYFLPDGHGLDWMTELRETAPHAAVVLLTGHGGEALAVRAFQQGVRDYLSKADLSPERLNGCLDRVLGVVRQQTHAAHSTAELLRVKGELDHFLRAISHDMGANLMLMESTVDVLKHETAPVARPIAAEGFAHLEACLRQSNRFIHDLVDLARSGTVEMEPSSVRPSEIAQQVLFEQRRLLAERGFDASCDVDLPTAWVHPMRLKQVLTNLVRNAARHGGAAESPQIRISLSRDPALPLPPDWPHQVIRDIGQGPLWIAVYDNGTGIPANVRDEIFLPGKRLPTAHSEGTGMGLAIVKKIIDHYNGRVLVDPRPSIGTAMLFSLPRPE